MRSGNRRSRVPEQRHNSATAVIDLVQTRHRSVQPRWRLIEQWTRLLAYRVVRALMALSLLGHVRPQIYCSYRYIHSRCIVALVRSYCPDALTAFYRE